ncbi:MAG TPA: NTP transferase domain-containing protein [Thermoanaerobaculales bacterium]|nr:NTP transferase domain-containing protein [Thermoanaerobaculales bacterium]HQL31160.1 NTP transferase domain-containing protein [Thermoanaerobaculales bacterium]HQN94724.1 NTP transferase domain-containing protein [Thermoanaerobaculales bacterium]
MAFAGLILAGGEGRRFGQPKALARLPDGRTFLEACCGTLTAAGARPVAATLPPRHSGHEVPGLLQIPLPGPGLDMLGSVRWGLRQLASIPSWSAVVVLPVDHPLVGAAAIAELVAVDAAAAVPSYQGKHGHPVVLAREVAVRVVRDERAGATLRDLLRTVEAVDVAVDDPGVVANCNTPEALRGWLERFG